MRILLGDLPRSLYDTVSSAIGADMDFEVVGVATQPSQLLLAATQSHVDVVVVGLVNGELPGIASHLLDQVPSLIVVAVDPDGRRCLVHWMHPRTDRIDVASQADLLRAIRTGVDPVPVLTKPAAAAARKEIEMAVTIRSLRTTGPLLVPLATGGTVRLSPGEVSPELPDTAVANSAKVEKLLQRGVIAVEKTGGAAEKQPSDKTTDRQASDKRTPDKPGDDASAQSNKRPDKSE